MFLPMKISYSDFHSYIIRTEIQTKKKSSHNLKMMYQEVSTQSLKCSTYNQISNPFQVKCTS